MIGIRQNHLSAGSPQLSWGDGFNIGQGANGHEAGRMHRAVRRVKDAGPSLSLTATGLAVKGEVSQSSEKFRLSSLP
jgi:hypothetical protein